MRPTSLLFTETSMQTYSLSEESFGYNYGCIRSSASHACREMMVLKKWKKWRKLHLFAAMMVTFLLVCHA